MSDKLLFEFATNILEQIIAVDLHVLGRYRLFEILNKKEICSASWVI